MKKVVFLSAVVALLPMTTFAYDDYYSGSFSSGSGVIIFFSLVCIAAAILQIILFFKIWKMTNDVDAMRKKVVDQTGATLSSDLLSANYTAILACKGETEAKAYLKQAITEYIGAYLLENSSINSELEAEKLDSDKMADKIQTDFGNLLDKAGVSFDHVRDVLTQRYPKEWNDIKVGETIERLGKKYKVLAIDTVANNAIVLSNNTYYPQTILLSKLEQVPS